ALAKLAAVQQPMERMQAVIARGADLAQRCFQVLGRIEQNALADREGGHSVGWHHVHSVISVPSAGICQPARSRVLRSSEPFCQAGLELLICKNTFRAMSRPARLSIAP